MYDIIVCFDEKKMGYGDILFAAKLAHQLKNSLINQGKLAGNIYLVCHNDKRGLAKLESSKADCEFGINFVLFEEIDKLIYSGKIKPAVIIDAPAPMPMKITCPNAYVIISLEYTYGPFLAAKLGNSYQHAPEEKQLSYQEELEKFENGMLKQYKNKDKVVLRTGLLNILDEHGVIPSPRLVAFGNLLHSNETQHNAAEIDEQKQTFFSTLPQKTRKCIFSAEAKAQWTQYEQNNHLTFGYGYAGSQDFLSIHQAYVKDRTKNEDVFIVSTNTNLSKRLELLIDSLKNDGFTKVIYHDYDTGTEQTLYESGKQGRSYRLIHSKQGLTHPEVESLFAISGDLSLATGDQSFVEAILTNKKICYDCFPHKDMLYSAYQDLGDTYSPATQEALKLMRLSSSIQSVWSPDVLERLASLLHNRTVERELSAINQDIRNRESLVTTYLHAVEEHLPEITHPIDLAIINNAFKKSMLAEANYPYHLFLAIRYGRKEIVRDLLNNQVDCLTATDLLGNNAFIIAAQYQHYDLLKLLIQHAEKNGISFTQITSPNNHFACYTIFDYLPKTITENPDRMADLFSSYTSDAQQSPKNHSADTNNKHSDTLMDMGIFKEQNKWLILKDHLEKTFCNINENDGLQKLKPFLIVAREYLRDKPKFLASYKEVHSDCEKLECDENWIYSHRMDYLKMRKEVEFFIEAQPLLSEKLGLQWLPLPPPSLWQAMELQLMLHSWKKADESELPELMFPYLVVMREYCKNHSEESDLIAITSLCNELNIPEDWPQHNKEAFANCCSIVSCFIKENNELTKYSSADDAILKESKLSTDSIHIRLF
ncbi:ankyrin repeat domain-containing protein [Legionella hackeliae]|uniref:Uncharacterized protein n=1 Tax=Legionella hackeliae TaxID=449 RepID=A0A0A8UU21_LEGHA|nr:ankyrin repeat domain-containing protein [Legionella hackeliae]KTD13876.1 Ankyrin repeats (3 copies) [Legionella hackeliae]CEK10577.1 protein of unknown function [ankyrin domain] [Legionella hackeliae]STX47319.1 Ankyrin repeats (3 copies) [Legionella hackeliae]